MQVLLCLLASSMVALGSSVPNHHTKPFVFNGLESLTVAQMQRLSSLGVNVASTLFNDQNQDASGHVSLRRVLGDFDQVNALFENAVFKLPDDTLTEELPLGGSLTVELFNMRASTITIGDIVINYEEVDSGTLAYEMQIQDLDMRVDMDYSVTFGFLPAGAGSATALTDNNSVRFGLNFISTDFDVDPRITASVETCDVNINIIDLTFQGDILALILDAVELLLRDSIETDIATSLCEDLGSLGNTTVKDLLDSVGDTLSTYLLPLSMKDKDPLAAENALEVPEDIALVNLNGDVVGEWFYSAMDDVNALFTDLTEDPEGPTGTGTDLGVNVFLRDFLLEDDRSITLEEFPFLENGVIIQSHSAIADATVRLERLKLFGLDTVTKLEPIASIGNYTMQSGISIGYISIEADLTMDIKPSTTPDSIFETPGSNVVSERVKLRFGVDEINSVVSLLFALDQDALGELRFGQLLDSSSLLACLWKALFALELTEVSLTVGNLREPSFDGFISAGIDRVISVSVEAFYSMYEAVLLKALPTLIHTTIREQLNEALLQSPGECPEAATQKPTSGFVDFRDMFLDAESSVQLGGSGKGQYGNLLRGLRDVLNELLVVAPEDRSSIVNDFLIGSLTKAQSGQAGSLVFNGDLLDLSNLDLGTINTLVELRVYDARVENLDSFGAPLSLWNPIRMAPSELNNTVSFGVGEKPLRLVVSIVTGFLNNGSRDELDIRIDLSSVTVIVKTLLKMVEDSLFSFPLGDFLNLNCWLSTIPAPALDARGIRLPDAERTAALSRLAVSVASLGVDITCVSCSSYVQDLVEQLSSSESAEDITASVNEVVEYGTSLLSDNFLQVQIDRLLSEAPMRCPHRDEYQENPPAAVYEPLGSVDKSEGSLHYLIAVCASAGFLFLVIACLMIVRRWIVNRRHARWLRSLPDSVVAALHAHQENESEKEAELNRVTTSMFFSQATPLLVRYLIPVVLIGNFILFISGHLSAMNRVIVDVELAGIKFDEDIFGFIAGQADASQTDAYSIAGTEAISTFWNNGGQGLVIVLAIFSGVIPYTKLIATMILWFLPPRIVSVTRRGSVLLWLEVLGKWSIVDVFILVIAATVFQLSIETPELSFIPDDLFSLNILLVPVWGFYANVTAQLVSQVTSRVVIYYHRRIVSAAEQEQEKRREDTTFDAANEGEGVSHTSNSEVLHQDVDENPEKLCDHAFKRPHRGQSDAVRVRRGVNQLVIVVAVVMYALVVAGCVLPTFSFQLTGLLGIAYEFGQRLKEAGLFDIVQLLVDQAKYLGTAGDYIGLLTVSIFMVGTIFVVPFFQSALLLRQWFSPMRKKAHLRVRGMLEVLQAWQYTEVYLFAAIVSIWQLGPISEYLVGIFCEGISDLFPTLVLFGILGATEAQCLGVDGALQEGTYILIGAVLLLALLNTFVIKAFSQFQRDLSEITVLYDDRKLNDSTELWNGEDNNEFRSAIHPVPVLFSDTFRWVLEREDSHRKQRTSSSNQGTMQQESKNSGNVPAVSSPESSSIISTNRSGAQGPKRNASAISTGVTMALASSSDSVDSDNTATNSNTERTRNGDTDTTVPPHSPSYEA